MAKKHGTGIAAVWYPTGLSGGGDPSQAIVKMQLDGSVDVIIGSVDLGEGIRTVVRQMAAEELGVPIEKVSVTGKLTYQFCRSLAFNDDGKAARPCPYPVRFSVEAPRESTRKEVSSFLGCHLPRHTQPYDMICKSTNNFP